MISVNSKTLSFSLNNFYPTTTNIYKLAVSKNINESHYTLRNTQNGCTLSFWTPHTAGMVNYDPSRIKNVKDYQDSTTPISLIAYPSPQEMIDEFSLILNMSLGQMSTTDPEHRAFNIEKFLKVLTQNGITPDKVKEKIVEIKTIEDKYQHILEEGVLTNIAEELQPYQVLLEKLTNDLSKAEEKVLDYEGEETDISAEEYEKIHSLLQKENIQET